MLLRKILIKLSNNLKKSKEHIVMDLSLKELDGILIKDNLKSADQKRCLARFQLFGVKEIQYLQ